MKRRKKVNHAWLWKQLLIWCAVEKDFGQNKATTKKKKNIPLSMSTCCFSSLSYTSAFAGTCLTRSGRITDGCACLTACVSYKHTFVYASVSVVSLHIRCDFSFGWLVRAGSGQVITFMCLHTRTWDHLAQRSASQVQSGCWARRKKYLCGHHDLGRVHLHKGLGSRFRSDIDK